MATYHTANNERITNVVGGNTSDVTVTHHEFDDTFSIFTITPDLEKSTVIQLDRDQLLTLARRIDDKLEESE